MSELTCFKAYDIRGEIGVNIDQGIAYRSIPAVTKDPHDTQNGKGLSSELAKSELHVRHHDTTRGMSGSASRARSSHGTISLTPPGASIVESCSPRNLQSDGESFATCSSVSSNRTTS